MKKITLLFAFAFSAIGMNAQNFYNFTASQATYADVTGGTSLNNNAVWDWEEFGPVNLPFTFTVAGHNVTSFLFAEDNFLLLAPGADYETSDEGVYYIVPNNIYLQDRTFSTGTSTSPISYKVEGEVGSRILKLEVKNAGLEDAVDMGFSEDEFYLNYQVWLYEGTNTIEMRYGPHNITDVNAATDGDGLVAGLVEEDSKVYFLSGNAAAPTYGEYTEDTLPGQLSLLPYPANGMVYKFTPAQVAGTPLFSAPVVSLYPNPASSMVNVSSNGFVSTQYTITNTIGAVISHGNLNSTDNAQVNIETLAGGMYFINVDGQHLKFIKR